MMDLDEIVVVSESSSSTEEARGRRDKKKKTFGWGESIRNMVSSTGFVYSVDVSSTTTNNSTQNQTQTQNQNQIQSFDANNGEMFNLEMMSTATATTTGMEMEMEMMIGFPQPQPQPQKNLLLLQQPTHDPNSVFMWKGFFGKHGNHSDSGPSSSSSSKTATATADFYHQHHHHQHHQQFNKSDFSTQTQTSSENLMVAPESSAAWQENRLMVDHEHDPSSSLRCVFPCEGNERPSQGLSLSLSSTNPSAIGLQSFELRHTTAGATTTTPTSHHQGQHDDDDDDDDDHMITRFLSANSRDGFFGKSAAAAIQEQLQMMQHHQDGFLGKSAAAAANLNHQANFQLRNSKYLAPAQQLLNEFCNLGTQQILHPPKQKPPPKATNQFWEDDNIGTTNNTTTTTSCSRNPSLYSLELLELQKRKSKLLSMLEEVDKRYNHYCNQMKAVVSTFESVAGNGAAKVYLALASKAMSRHFRCLREGIVGQIQATKKAMGEKVDPVGVGTVGPTGTSRGETPRLRLLDQALRQQRVFQQMSMMETHPWRPQRGLPERSVSVLRAWLFEHFLHPYPSDVDKHILARQTGLSRSQVSNWFINARVRLWKPMVEEMYLEETKEQDSGGSPDGHTNLNEEIDYGRRGNHNHNNNNNNLLQPRMEDQKPTAEQLVRIDSECLSSIINNNHQEKNDSKNGKSLQNHQQLGRVAEAFGAMELDFSTYNQQHNNSTVVSGAGGGSGGVSLTLGLQQHGDGGVSLAFSPTSQTSLFYTSTSTSSGRDPIEDCQPSIQYSLLDGEGHNLPYRNLMGAQLLHDLAG